jgi:hypothetical protein
MVAVVILVVDEGRDGPLEVTLEVVVFEQDAAFQGQVPSLVLALCRGMIWLGGRVTPGPDGNTRLTS